MRVGHAGVALGAQRVCPRLPLWLLLCAAYGPDIIEVTARPFGFRDTLWSHSLVSLGICATLLAGVYAVVRRDPRGAAILWLTYVLHWPADFITGIKPTWPGGPEVGLLFYKRHEALVWIIDLATLGAGWWFYRARRATTAQSAGG